MRCHVCFGDTVVGSVGSYRQCGRCGGSGVDPLTAPPPLQQQLQQQAQPPVGSPDEAPLPIADVRAAGAKLSGVVSLARSARADLEAATPSFSGAAIKAASLIGCGLLEVIEVAGPPLLRLGGQALAAWAEGKASK